MLFTYQTERLILSVLNENYAETDGRKVIWQYISFNAVHGEFHCNKLKKEMGCFKGVAFVLHFFSEFIADRTGALVSEPDIGKGNAADNF